MKEFINNWENRPSEIRALLNPAFCGLLIYAAIVEYKRINKQDINITLLFLILPLILNSNLKEIINTNKSKNLIYIVNNNKSNFQNFDYIFNYYVEYTYEAIYFLYFNEHIEIFENKFIIKGNKIRFNEIYFKKHTKVIAALIRVFSKIKSESTIYSTLGVTHES